MGDDPAGNKNLFQPDRSSPYDLEKINYPASFFPQSGWMGLKIVFMCHLPGKRVWDKPRDHKLGRCEDVWNKKTTDYW